MRIFFSVLAGLIFKFFDLQHFCPSSSQLPVSFFWYPVVEFCAYLCSLYLWSIQAFSSLSSCAISYFHITQDLRIFHFSFFILQFKIIFHFCENHMTSLPMKICNILFTESPESALIFGVLTMHFRTIDLRSSTNTIAANNRLNIHNNKKNRFRCERAFSWTTSRLQAQGHQFAYTTSLTNNVFASERQHIDDCQKPFN